MANSRFEYVKAFELDDKLLPGCWIVVRLDGRGFTKFAQEHGFEKPNDVAALELMDKCAQAVCSEFSDVRIAFGVSDEYSFVLHKHTILFDRRASKLVSLVVSCFTGRYVALWPEAFPTRPLRRPPMFDGRAVCYPTDAALRDYLAWRQVDTHINNQFNTCFWALVKGGKSPAEAQAVLKAGFKNQLLFSSFGINYNSLPERFRKGSVIIRQQQASNKLCSDGTAASDELFSDGTAAQRAAAALPVMHVDIIKDDFWHTHPDVLA